MQTLDRPSLHFPAPWTLKGEGIILVYKFSKAWVAAHAFLDDYQKGNFKGGLGYVMLVNYHESPVGPYRELLIIPGKFKTFNRQSISRIFVDSASSTENGRYNWGIPKETVPMLWQSENNVDTIGVGPEDDPIFFCRIKTKGISFPATTGLMPIRLQQVLGGKTFLTDPKGSGWAKLATVEKLNINPERFPDFSGFRPLLCFKVNPFTMHFPISQVVQHAQ